MREAAPAFLHRAAPLVAGLSPTETFLLRTLVWRPTLLSRNGTSCITVRRWRTGMKEFQIDALREARRSPSAAFVAACARDLLAGLEGIVASSLYSHVVPAPCGRSDPETCLSGLLAEKLAVRLRLTFVEALSAARVDDAAHPPSKNAGRPPMIVREALAGPTVLVDDVAATGRTLEEATRLLRQSAPAVLAVAWIGGAVADASE